MGVNDNKSVRDTVELNLYTEISSGKTFEGKLFDGFVLVRPVLPHLWGQTRKVDLVDFGKEFEDFQGDRQELLQFVKKNPQYSWKNVVIHGGSDASN